MTKKYEKVIWTACIIVGVALFMFTRGFEMGNIPKGIHIDEASMTYNAWCIATFGVDQFQNSFPAYFPNFGGGQSALCIYLTALLIKLFGFSAYIGRITAILSSLMGIFATMKIAEMIWEKEENSRRMSFLTALLMLICPYFIMASRIALDCNLMMGFSALLLYFVLKALKSGKNTDYIAVGVLAGLVLYSYVISYLIMILFLVFLMIYAMWTRKTDFKKMICAAVPLGIMAIPLICVQIINMFDLPPFKLGPISITKMEQYRASEIGKISLVKMHQAFNVIFMGDGLLYNSVPGFDNLYWITIPLCILGLVAWIYQLIKSIRNRTYTPSVIIFLWIVAMFYFESHFISNTNKINGIFAGIVLCTVEGILTIRKVPGKIGTVLFGMCLCIYLICFARFASFYFGGDYTNLAKEEMDYYSPDYSGVLQRIQQDQKLAAQEIYMEDSYVYYTMAMRPSPYEFTADKHEDYQNAHFMEDGYGPIDASHVYLVKSKDTDYAEQLRMDGFTEEDYEDILLFYQ